MRRQVKRLAAKIKALSFGLLIAAIIAGGLYYFLREETLEDTKKESVLSRMAFSGSHLTESQDGKKVWDLTARIMEVDPKTQWVYMTDMKGLVFRSDGTEMVVTGKNAVVDPKTRNMQITGGIEMKASDGPTFRAEEARYIAKDHKIFAS